MSKSSHSYGASKTLLEIVVAFVGLFFNIETVVRIAIGGPAGNDADEVFVAELDDIYLGRGVLYVRHL